MSNREEEPVTPLQSTGSSSLLLLPVDGCEWDVLFDVLHTVQGFSQIAVESNEGATLTAASFHRQPKIPASFIEHHKVSV